MSEHNKNTLFQKRIWHGINHLSLRDGQVLKVVKTAKIKTVSYIIDIISLDSVSHRRYRIAWHWLIAALVLSLFAFATIKYPVALNGLQQTYSAGITVLVAICAVASFVLFWLSSSRKQVFYTRHVRIPLIEIWVGQPTGKSFRQYVKLLSESIQQAQESSRLSHERQLSGEMKMLRRLVDEGVINREVYEKAKANLFSKF